MTSADLLSWLLTYAAHSTLLLGAAWLVTRRLIQSHAVRDVVWKTALIGGLVTSTVQVAGWAEGSMGGWAVRLRVPAEVAWATASGNREPGTGNGNREFGAAPSSQPAQTWLDKAADVPAPGPSPEVSISSSGTESVRRPVGSSPAVLPFPLLTVAWAIIAASLLLHFVLARARLAFRLGRRQPVIEGPLAAVVDSLRHTAGLRRAIRLTWAPGLSSPVALGFSEICVPEAALTELDPDQQHSMLAHELAHLARLDPLWLDLSGLLERLFFFQPLNRLARRRIQDGAEYLCDDWAVRRTGSGLNLAKCLVKVAEWMDTAPPAVPVSGMAERRSQLVSRIHRLIENRAMFTRPNPRWLVPAAAVLLIVTAAAAPGFTSSARESNTLLALQDTSRVAGDSSSAEFSRVERRRSIQMTHEMTRSRAALREAMRNVPKIPRAALAPTAPMPMIAPIPARAPRPDLAPMPALAPLARIFGQRLQDTSGAAVPALLTALKDPEVEVRRAAVQSLGNLEDARAVPGLIDALKDSDAEVRARAAQGLGQLHDERATDGLIGVLKDPNAEVRAAAVQSLGELKSRPAVSGLATALHDDSRDVRRAAVQALSEMENAHPVDALLGALKDSDSEVRQTAANALGSLEDRHAVKPLIALLSDPVADVRQAAAQSLGSLQDPEAAEPLAAVIRDANADVREAAAQSLGELELKMAPQGLLDALKDPNRDVRRAAVQAVGQIRDVRAVPALRALLEDTDPDVRENAVDALSEIRDRAALDVLIGALKSKDPNVRKRAAEALGQRDD